MKRFKDLINETPVLELYVQISAAALFVYALWYGHLGASLNCAIMWTGVLFFTPITLLLSKRGHTTLAGVLFVVSDNLYVLTSTLALRNQGGVEYYFLVLTVLPLVIFGLNRRLLLLLLFPLPLIGWVMSVSRFMPDIPATWTPLDLPFKLIYCMNFLGSFTLMTFFLGIFVRSIFKLKEAGICDANDRENELKNIFESMQEGLVIQDSAGKIINYNPAALHILGLTSDQLTGRTSMDPSWRAIKEDESDFPGTSHPAMIALQTGIPQQNVLMGVHQPNGELHWILINATPFFEGDPKPTLATGVLCTFLDITDRRMIEKKLIESTKLSSLGQMAAGIAHEVNTPLAVISGKSETLRIAAIDGTLDPKYLIIELEKIEKTAGRIGKIIKGIKSFSRNADQDPMAATHLHQMVEDTLELCKDLFKYSGVELRVHYDKTLTFDCQSTQISQIILNLIRNSHDAVQALQERWVQLDAIQKADKILISVTDSGLGIPPDTLAKMMQPFFTTKGVGKGTGLGLSISRGIATAHGGQLTYDSSGPNTRFVLELPLSHKK